MMNTARINDQKQCYHFVACMLRREEEKERVYQSIDSVQHTQTGPKGQFERVSRESKERRAKKALGAGAIANKAPVDTNVHFGHFVQVVRPVLHMPGIEIGHAAHQRNAPPRPNRSGSALPGLPDRGHISPPVCTTCAGADAHPASGVSQRHRLCRSLG